MVERLTPAEDRILRLKAEGLTDREVSARFGTSEHTIGSQLYSVYRKLGAHNITEAYIAMGWLRVPYVGHRANSGRPGA